MVSWSISTVSTTRHISMSCCQSRLLRAKRETSRAATAPTLPRQTSATIRSKPARATPPPAQPATANNSTKPGARAAARRRAPEIVIDRFDARPAQRRQTIAHRILQGAALAIVENLMGGGTPYIQDRLALQMVRPDLLRRHDASPPVPEGGRRRRGRRSGGPSASSAYVASRRVTPAIAASAPRRRAGRRTDRTDVHCCEDDDER